MFRSFRLFFFDYCFFFFFNSFAEFTHHTQSAYDSARSTTTHINFTIRVSNFICFDFFFDWLTIDVCGVRHSDSLYKKKKKKKVVVIASSLVDFHWICVVTKNGLQPWQIAENRHWQLIRNDIGLRINRVIYYMQHAHTNTRSHRVLKARAIPTATRRSTLLL